MIELPANIRHKISKIIEEKEGHNYPIDDEARSHGAIALMGTIGKTWGLRPNGTFWEFDEGFGTPLTPLDEQYHTMAIVAGVERYEWLHELLPVRPNNAANCNYCKGRGAIGAEPDKGIHGIFCDECNALGWTNPG